MFKLNKKIHIVLFVLASVLLSAPASAMVGIHPKGDWPQDWPAELEPYRNRAKTYEIATGNQENVYEIHFNGRAELENIWPIVLKLKDSGAPLRLESIEATFASGKTLFDNTRPVLRIYSYVWPAYDVNCANGKSLRPAPPWPGSITPPVRQLPEYVMPSPDCNSWVPVNDNKCTGFMYRARTEIELVVDGAIIDLNRIQLPADTVIIDKRRLTGNQRIAEDHTEWIGRCIILAGSIKPGATRRDLLEVFTTEGGVYTRQQRQYVYKDCPYIKVDVSFQPVDNNNRTREDPNDIITKISKPYLQFSIAD